MILKLLKLILKNIPKIPVFSKPMTKTEMDIRAGCTTMNKFKVTILIYQGGVFMGNFMGNKMEPFILTTEKL